MTAKERETRPFANNREVQEQLRTRQGGCQSVPSNARTAVRAYFVEQLYVDRLVAFVSRRQQLLHRANLLRRVWEQLLVDEHRCGGSDRPVQVASYDRSTIPKKKSS